MGLLNAIVPRDELLDAARGFARRIIANAPLAVQATKQSALQGLYHDEDATRALREAVKALRGALGAIDAQDPDSSARAVAACADVLDELGRQLRTPFEKESRLSSAVFQTEDAKEGPRAFAEKRPPVWQAK
jgi:enoyl-CoA hydratase